MPDVSSRKFVGVGPAFPARALFTLDKPAPKDGKKFTWDPERTFLAFVK